MNNQEGPNRLTIHRVVPRYGGCGSARLIYRTDGLDSKRVQSMKQPLVTALIPLNVNNLEARVNLSGTWHRFQLVFVFVFSSRCTGHKLEAYAGFPKLVRTRTKARQHFE